jgi:quinoprotein dehydrogenase-associated probable ABC transporter substrate-binding protein
VTGAARASAAVALLTVLLAAAAARADPVSYPGAALRVCADPANLPFSNRQRQGFENEIARLFAADLGLPLEYIWWPQTMGFIRNTLKKRQCDVVMGVATGFDLTANTVPYYRSSYALVFRARRGIALKSLGDPSLKRLRIGAVARTPPVDLLAANGLLGRTRFYRLTVDTRHESPGRQIVKDVLSGALDLGVVWGPIAGYQARRPGPGNQGPGLRVVPLTSVPNGPKVEFAISIGVRRGDSARRHALNHLIERKRPRIEAILRKFGVPLVAGDQKKRS